MNILKVLVLLFVSCAMNAAPCSNSDGGREDCISDKSVLDVAILLANKKQGKAFRLVTDQFEKDHPHIRIKISPFKDAAYKQNMANWVMNKSGPDILYWQAGERLFDIVRKGAIKNITHLWHQNNWASQFPEQLSSLVSLDEQKYALPFAYYHWGFYYKKSLFEKLEIKPPENWSEFLAIGDTAKKQGMEFIAIGTKEKWTSAAWFDYLNLRTNGASFHEQVLDGSVSFGHPKLRSVFETWQKLVQLGYFASGHEDFSWQEAMPMIYRETAAVSLIGNFTETLIPDHIKADIGFFPFPILDAGLDAGVGLSELVPTEIWSISSWTNKEMEASLFLKYLARPDIQELLAKALGYIPANLRAQEVLSPLAQEGKKLLLSAGQTFQYLDRDAPQQFADHAINAFSKFMLDANIDQLVRNLDSNKATSKGLE